MSYEKVAQAKRKIIGTKQTLKALKSGSVLEVVVALDADPLVTKKIIDLAELHKVPISTVDSMDTLGEVAGIDIGATTVAITR